MLNVKLHQTSVFRPFLHTFKRQYRPIVRPPGQQRMYLERLKLSNPKVYEIINQTRPSATVANPAVKVMSDSYVEEFLRFKSNPQVKEDYLNYYGGIRIGKILEDLDALAGSISYLHCAETTDFIIVTASVDRIDLLTTIPADKDLKISGHVSYVGTSSMEVLLSLESCLDEAPPLGSERIGEMGSKSVKLEPFKILEAKFIMVALDKNTLKARKVPGLKVETELEKYYFSQGSRNKMKKNLSQSISLEKIPPSIEEMIQIHNLYLQYKQYLDPSFNKKKPDNVIWMKDTIQRSLVLCMPQDRNVHNKIFGGFLMKLAFELAYSTGYIFAKSRISFVALDDITFKQPVSIGSLLSLTSQVTYSAATTRCFQVKVKADVIDPLTNQQATTNTFHFTFEAHSEQNFEVMPRSYDETMRYIEGQRKQFQSLRSQGIRTSQP